LTDLKTGRRTAAKSTPPGYRSCFLMLTVSLSPSPERTGRARLQRPLGGSGEYRRPAYGNVTSPSLAFGLRATFWGNPETAMDTFLEAAKGLAELFSGPRKGPGPHHRYERVRGESGELEFQLDELDVFFRWPHERNARDTANGPPFQARSEISPLAVPDAGLCPRLARTVELFQQVPRTPIGDRTLDVARVLCLLSECFPDQFRSRVCRHLP
jgi:hypothetical protein